MEIRQPNPIYQRLTRNFDSARQRTYLRLAIGAPIATVALATAAFFAAESLPVAFPLYAVPIVVILISLVSLPVAAGVANQPGLRASCRPDSRDRAGPVQVDPIECRRG